MPQPTAYYPNYSFTQYQVSHPTQPLPGAEVDAELFSIATSITEICQNLAMIQRADGALANGSVGVDQLASELTIGFNTPTFWGTGISYVPRGAVYSNNSIYVCLVAHTATVFATDLAAGYWALVVNTGQFVNAASASATAAATSATSAATSATSASTSATNAAASAAAAAASAVGIKVVTNAACATTANITLSGEQTIDGVLTSASRVLVKNQSTASQNGVYVSAAGAWARSTDANTWNSLISLVITISGGTTNSALTFIADAQAGGTIGTTALAFNTFNSSITDGSVTTSKIAAAAVTNAKLASMAAATVKGSVAGGVPADLTTAQLTALINAFTTLLSGSVPASGGGTTNFLRADGNWAAPPNGIVTVKTQLITTTSTYTPNTGMTYVLSFGVGGGGAGGGSNANTGNNGVAGAGSAATLTIGLFTAAQIGVSQAATIGAKGTGVSGNNGNAGGQTSLGALLTAPGGLGGDGVNTTTIAGTFAPGTASPAAGTGLISVPGQPGGPGFSGGSSIKYSSGQGGSGLFGSGGQPKTNTGGDAAGNNATGKGAGGGGSFSNSSNTAGGNGSDGVLLMIEFCSQ